MLIDLGKFDEEWVMPTEKACSRCLECKPIDEFGLHSGRRDGRQSLCRQCQRHRMREHYQANKHYYVEKARRRTLERKAALREWLVSYLREHPCVDCGEDDLRCLQFDHVRGTKANHVSILVAQGVGLEVLAAEIQKCEVRCANCHMRRTAEQFGWWTAFADERDL